LKILLYVSASTFGNQDAGCAGPPLPPSLIVARQGDT
jgi:hypothetical protein